MVNMGFPKGSIPLARYAVGDVACNIYSALPLHFVGEELIWDLFYTFFIVW